MSVGVVVLAAGFGTRLAPLTDDTPKPLLEVGDRAVLDHLLDRVADVDVVDDVVVVTNDCHPQAWARWLATTPSRRRLAVSVVSNGVVEVDRRRGAVADLWLGISMLGATDLVLVIAGDNLLDEPLGPHIAAARASGRSQVLCRHLGDAVPPARFGEITTDDTGRIVGFREKPPDPRSPLAATCTYVLAPDDIAGIGAYLDEGHDPDSPGGFVAWLSDRRYVHARTLTGRYFDIGNHETLAAARDAYG